MPSRTPRDPDAPARRVVIVVLDGLRADLVGDPRFPTLAAMTREAAHTLDATTVLPSVTAAAMTSLLTGVAPAMHGMDSDKFRFPAPRIALDPLPRVVAEHGLPTFGAMAQVPWLFRPLARRIVGALGMRDVVFGGANAHALLAATLPVLRHEREGLVLLHWPEADALGHAHGWCTPPYLAAVQRMDHALGALRRELAAHDDGRTLLLVLADHGGGGRVPRHHDSAHPLDCTIPIFLEGAGVRPMTLGPAHTLLDVPATVLWALGIARPATYAGTPITAPFAAGARAGGAIPALAVA